MFHGNWMRGRRRHMFERGALKYLILDLISKKPRHGYDIIREIEESCGGYYVPSPGTIYPTLQMLEDLGHVKVKEENGKKVYELTDEGQAFLDTHKEKVKQHRERMAECCGGGEWQEGASLTQDIRGLLQFIRHSVRHNLGDTKKVEAIREILEKAKKEVEAIVKT